MKSSNRSFISLFNALSFVVLVVTGILSFVRPFSIQVVGLHALMGFVFVGLIGVHVVHNLGHLKRYFRSKSLWLSMGLTVGLTVLFLWQPEPVRRFMRLSQNLGPALDRFEVTDRGLTYRYIPAPQYKMTLNVRAGNEFDSESPPHVAIWLENASFYHIKTLHEPQRSGSGRAALPYWDFKLRGWEEAKLRAIGSGKGLKDAIEVDAISGATRNSSFDPADYIIPGDSQDPMIYRLLIEVDQPEDGQASLVYAVEIDNADPRAFQVLELMGYPKRNDDDESDKEVWELYYVDERFNSALELIDSALLTIDRNR